MGKSETAKRKLPEYRVLPAGDTALVIEFGDAIDRRLSALVLALARRLSEAPLNGLLETVPTFRSLMLYYDPLLLPAASLLAHIDEVIKGLDPREQAGRSWRLPVCYDTSLAADLDEVAARTGLSPRQIIERHSGTPYHVYMLGFLPGQAYMGDVPDELALPRREVPRLQIAPGSVAIATSMTCIFPLATPCGWHVIGHSPVALWENEPHPRALLAPGDRVTFAPISLSEHEHLLAQAAEHPPRIADSKKREAAA